jgi:hypothetical protein
MALMSLIWLLTAVVAGTNAESKLYLRWRLSVRQWAVVDAKVSELKIAY